MKKIEKRKWKELKNNLQKNNYKKQFNKRINISNKKFRNLIKIL